MSDLFHFLRRVPFFESIPDAEISIIADACHKQHFAAGDIVFHEGEPGNNLFIVFDGSVEIWKNYSTTGKSLLSVYGPGQLFGELALIDSSPRSATVVVRQTCTLLSIDQDNFNLITHSNPISKSIMRSLSATIRKRTESFSQGLRIRDRKLEKLSKELKKFQISNMGELREREKFVRQTHRQFGNHLRLIADMMNLQAEYISDSRTLNMFRRSWSRVNALALIQETISRKTYDIYIEMDAYIRSLVKNIQHTFRIRAEEVLVDITVEDISLHPEEVFPIGLIINELLTGPFIAASEDKSFSHIHISLADAEDEEIELTVNNFSTLMTEESNLSDAGIAASDLVRSLVENYLGGRMQIDSNGHIRFVIRFLPGKR
ncbi:MAG: cyclic nucleotide-binding domain-containing protein [Desulfococcaceae bacterium]|jgi:CRP-like cAMP-binding protein|nr:cyclic nucleotide-binding domain-containing protein [Desulfococcaceae bacterium]